MKESYVLLVAVWLLGSAGSASAQPGATPPAAPPPTTPAPPPSLAQPPAPPPGPAAGASAPAAVRPVTLSVVGMIEFGDTVTAEVVGRSDETAKMDLNDGYSAMVGASVLLYRAEPLTLEANLAVGFKYDSLESEGVELSYRSFPSQVGVYATLGAFRFGAGAAIQLDPEMTLSAPFLRSDVELELGSSVGPFLEAGLIFPTVAGTVWFTARKLWQTLYPEGQRSEEKDANAFGLSIGWAP
jgi:hypothetical protein